MSIGKRIVLNCLAAVVGVLALIFIYLTVNQSTKVTPTEKPVVLTGGPVEVISFDQDAGLKCGPDAELEGCAEELPELASPDAGSSVDAVVDAWVDPDAWTEMWGDLR
jgi:hypothetical protein